jgi:hypothetical protein
MANGDVTPGPIQFTGKEIAEARKGNYAPAEMRLKKELAARSRVLAVGGKPRTPAELRRLAGKAALGA